MSLLTNDQKRALGILAHKAWLVCPDREALLAVNSEMSATAVEAAWRHVQQGQAVGIQSLRMCTQDHFGRLKAHFLKLAGEDEAATRAIVRDQDNGRRIAFFKLEQNLRERGLEMSYAGAICRNQFKCSLAEATEQQLWKLVYTVRNRKKPVKHAAAADEGNPF
jgi:hypothetical protein